MTSEIGYKYGKKDSLIRGNSNTETNWTSRKPKIVS